MSQEFLFLMNVVLISRLVYVFRDGPLSTGETVFLLVVQGIGLLAYRINVAWSILLAVLVVHTMTFQYLERRRNSNGGLRLLSLAVQVVILSVFFSPSIGIVFHREFFSFLESMSNYTVLVPLWGEISGRGSGVVLFGVLLVLNEVNLLLRFQLSVMRLAPGSANGKGSAETAADRREYNTGRVIGILERVLIYAAVLGNQIAAIGLVIAAKGFARFKEMDDRRFAEYVLVGTLLSALFAVLVALIVKSLLSSSL